MTPEEFESLILDEDSKKLSEREISRSKYVELFE